MNYKVTKKINIIDILFIGFFFFLSTLAHIFITNSYVRIIIEWLGFLSVCIKINKDFKIYRYDLLLILFTLLTIIELFLNIKDSFYSIILLLPFLLLPLFSKKDISYINKIFDVFIICDLVFAIATIVFSFYPSLYYLFVSKIYPESQELLISWYNQRCIAGLTSHYTTNGILMITGIIILFSRLLEKDSNTKKNKLHVFYIFILMIGLLLTGKRAQLLFGLFAVLVGYFVFLVKKKKSRMFKTVGAILIVLIVGYTLYNLFPSLFTFIDRFIQTTENGDVTLGRKKYWELAIDIYNKNKLIGIGWGNFKEYSYTMYGKTADVHNNYLQLLCEMGIIGFLSFIMMALVNLFRSIKIYSYIKIKEINFKYKTLLLFSVTYQVFFLVYCLTGNPLYTNVTYIPYFLTYAVVGYSYYKYKKGDLHE